MANVRRYNELFRLGDGAARVVPAGSKNIPGGPVAWGDAYVVYNPREKKNFSVTYGYASTYESRDHPVTNGKTVAELFGLPISNDTPDGQGGSFQHFERGYMAWSEARGLTVHPDLAVADGWVRRLPREQCGTLGPHGAGWGEMYFAWNPRLEKRFPIIHGFAQVYESRGYAESNGRPLCEVLGLPIEAEHGDGADGARQSFEGGALTWNPRDGVRVELAAKVDALVAGKAEAKGLRPLSLKDIAALGGGEVKPAKTPRLRMAPSPTGYLHIGNAWIAVINYLMAKKLGGEFLLRIEDTDPLRSKPEYTKVIEDSLRWLGIRWDGEVVFQSQRAELYRAKVDQLLAAGKAYEDPKTGGVFFKMPEQAVVHDRVKGKVSTNDGRPAADEDGRRDFMLLRPDGSPMFLLANTVDDGEQGITHVIRGEGHLLNAARQAALFSALGYEVPEFYHLPHIVGEDGAKLSKREGASSVLDFRDRGVDPDILLDHLAGLGMKGTKPGVRTLDELVAGFDRLGFQKTPSRIGLGALLEKMKQRIGKMETSELKKKLEAFDPAFMASLGKVGAHALAEAVKLRASTYEEAILIGKFVRAEPKYAESAAKVRLSEQTRAPIEDLARRLEASGQWTLGSLRAALEGLNRDRGIPFKVYAEALQWMLTGDTSGVPIEHTMAILGRDETLRRLGAVLGGRVALFAEPAEKGPVEARAPKPGRASAKPGPDLPALTGGCLAAYLKYAKALGAPIEEAKAGADGWRTQRFEHGIAGDHGQVQLHDRPFWMVGGKLDTHLRYRDLIGDPIGEAYRDEQDPSVWVQRFDHGLIVDAGQLLLDAHPQFWLTGGKLDAWLAARPLLGAPVGNAYYAAGQWSQEFEHGQTDDAGRVLLLDARFWIGGGLLKTWLEHREKLGLPIGEAFVGPGGVEVQDFEHGRADAKGRVTLRPAGVEPETTVDRAKVVDGALVQEAGQAAVYAVHGGAKLHIPSPEVFQRMGYRGDQIVQVSAGTLRSVPEIPAEGTVVREADHPETYVIRGGKKRHIPNIETFHADGFRIEDVRVVPDQSLSRVPQGIYPR